MIFDLLIARGEQITRARAGAAVWKRYHYIWYRPNHGTLI